MADRPSPADTSPRSIERTHPGRSSAMRNEVTPLRSGDASRGAVRRPDAAAGTGFPNKRMLPAARQRATGQIGRIPDPKGC